MTGVQWSGWVVYTAVTLALAGCGKTDKKASKDDPVLAPVQVETASVVQESIVDFREYTGRIAPVNSVQIRARVSGYLLQAPRSKGIPESESITNEPPNLESTATSNRVQATEGEFVRQGTLLFKIDAEPYVRLLEQAAGNLVAKRAQAERFELELTRTRDLIQSNSISKSDLDLATANAAEANGQISNLEASVAQAQLNVNFTQVTSPIDGLIGQTLVTNGNLVTADVTVLTTVVSTDPVYAYFDVDENSVLDYRSRARSGTVPSARDNSIPIDLGLANEQGFSHPGVIDFVNNTTDPGTGNTRMRGLFDNNSGALSPGLFARVRAPFSEEHIANLVPTKALAVDQAGKYVLIVDSDNIVRRQAVTVGPIRGTNVVIRDGVKAKDIVVVSGIQKIKAGVKVAPKLKNESGPSKPAKSDSQ